LGSSDDNNANAVTAAAAHHHTHTHHSHQRRSAGCAVNITEQQSILLVLQLHAVASGDGNPRAADTSFRSVRSAQTGRYNCTQHTVCVGHISHIHTAGRCIVTCDAASAFPVVASHSHHNNSAKLQHHRSNVSVLAAGDDSNSDDVSAKHDNPLMRRIAAVSNNVCAMCGGTRHPHQHNTQ